MQTSDPLRTPTYTLFPKPDYFFSTTGANVSINSGFAYDHGYYSPNIDVTWSALAGPGVAVRGVDGPQPAEGNQPSDPNSTRTVPQASTVGTWVEETDLRPTLLWLVGLRDDYQSDGNVLTQALSSVPSRWTGRRPWLRPTSRSTPASGSSAPTPCWPAAAHSQWLGHGRHGVRRGRRSAADLGQPARPAGRSDEAGAGEGGSGTSAERAPGQGADPPGRRPAGRGPPPRRRLGQHRPVEVWPTRNR